MEKEVKIVPPEGYEVDEENSTFDCIKFKPIQSKRWRDDKTHGLYGFVIRPSGFAERVGNVTPLIGQHIFATKKQAKSALAMAQISQIMANDERFGGVVTDEEWKDYIYKYIIARHNNCVCSCISTLGYHFLAFHSSDQRDLFLKENEDLVKDYLMID